jgi:hypothetical protein
MQMETFKVGDRVSHRTLDYTGGSIIAIRSGRTVDVQWDKGTSAWDRWHDGIGRCHGVSYLRKRQPLILQYDPTQQGDTDDDI